MTEGTRREFSEWFNTSYEDLDVDWMDHFDYWWKKSIKNAF